MRIANKFETLESRFNKRIEIKDMGYLTPCHVWVGLVNHDGYGHYNYYSSNLKPHIFFYEQKNGKVPDNLELDHLCRIRACCNAEHLEAVTHSENLKRGNWKNKNKTHCLRNHEFNDENTYISKDGKRQCKTCNREKAKIRMRNIRKTA